MNDPNLYRGLFKAVAAGALIGLGGMLYLTIENPVLGALYFAIGFVAITMFNLPLFTGKLTKIRLSYIPEKHEDRMNYILMIMADLALTLAGNFFGAVAAGALIFSTNEDLTLTSLILLHNKSNMISSCCVRAIICEIMIGIAANCNRSFFMILLSISSFIILGGEHIVANFFYVTATANIPANPYYLKEILFFTFIGNILGAIPYWFVKEEEE